MKRIKNKFLLVCGITFSTLTMTNLASCASEEVQQTFAIKTEYDKTQGVIRLSSEVGKVGDKISVTISPNEGYEIFSIAFNGENLRIQDRFEIEPSEGTNVLKVVFEETLPPIEDVENDWNIVVNYAQESGNVSLSKKTGKLGEKVNVTIATNQGYSVNSILFNGTNLELVNSFQVTPIEGENNLTVDFTKNIEEGSRLDKGFDIKDFSFPTVTRGDISLDYLRRQLDKVLDNLPSGALLTKWVNNFYSEAVVETLNISGINKKMLEKQINIIIKSGALNTLEVIAGSSYRLNNIVGSTAGNEIIAKFYETTIDLIKQLDKMFAINLIGNASSAYYGGYTIENIKLNGLERNSYKAVLDKIGNNDLTKFYTNLFDSYEKYNTDKSVEGYVKIYKESYSTLLFIYEIIMHSNNVVNSAEVGKAISFIFSFLIDPYFKFENHIDGLKAWGKVINNACPSKKTYRLYLQSIDALKRFDKPQFSHASNRGNAQEIKMRLLLDSYSEFFYMYKYLSAVVEDITNEELAAINKIYNFFCNGFQTDIDIDYTSEFVTISKLMVKSLTKFNNGDSKKIQKAGKIVTKTLNNIRIAENYGFGSVSGLENFPELNVDFITVDYDKFLNLIKESAQAKKINERLKTRIKECLNTFLNFDAYESVISTLSPNKRCDLKIQENYVLNEKAKVNFTIDGVAQSIDESNITGFDSSKYGFGRMWYSDGRSYSERLYRVSNFYDSNNNSPRFEFEGEFNSTSSLMVKTGSPEKVNVTVSNYINGENGNHEIRVSFTEKDIIGLDFSKPGKYTAFIQYKGEYIAFDYIVWSIEGECYKVDKAFCVSDKPVSVTVNRKAKYVGIEGQIYFTTGESYCGDVTFELDVSKPGKFLIDVPISNGSEGVAKVYYEVSEDKLISAVGKIGIDSRRDMPNNALIQGQPVMDYASYGYYNITSEYQTVSGEKYKVYEDNTLDISRYSSLFDTSTSGEHKVLFNLNGIDVEFSYYVNKLKKIQDTYTLGIAEFYRANETYEIPQQLPVLYQKVATYIDALGIEHEAISQPNFIQATNKSTLTKISHNTYGKHTIKGSLNGKSIDIQYGISRKISEKIHDINADGLIFDDFVNDDSYINFNYQINSVYQDPDGLLHNMNEYKSFELRKSEALTYYNKAENEIVYNGIHFKLKNYDKRTIKLGETLTLNGDTFVDLAEHVAEMEQYLIEVETSSPLYKNYYDIYYDVSGECVRDNITLNGNNNIYQGRFSYWRSTKAKVRFVFEGIVGQCKITITKIPN